MFPILRACLIILFCGFHLYTFAQFGTQRYLDGGLIPASYELHDLDNDGDLDILIQTVHTKLQWLENLGSGIFTNPIDIISGESLSSFSFIDMNYDGKVDIIVNSHEELYWKENLGAGSFSADHFIGTNADSYFNAVYPIDLDQDGDMDIIAGEVLAETFRFTWYENMGETVFSEAHVIAHPNSSPDELTGRMYAVAGDFNGDGANDVLFGSSILPYVAWYANLGDQTFSNAIYLETTNGFGTAFYPQSAVVCDLDEDGDSDVLASFGWNNEISWFENVDEAGLSSIQPISQMPDGRTVDAQDLDGDGDLDVIGGSSQLDGPVAWYENLGNGNFSSLNVVSEELSSINFVRSGDLDSDGDNDVLASTYVGDLVWFENDGSGSFIEHHHLLGGINPTSVNAYDFDNDGDIDVLASLENENSVVWYENLGNDSFSYSQTIATDVLGAAFTIGEDLDNDGDVDVISASAIENKIAWYQNDGNGGFSAELIVSDVAEGINSLFTHDLNGDNDVDIISTSTENNILSWYENIGDGNFSDQIIISSDFDGLRKVFADDLDSDGDADLITASEEDNKIGWFENLGNGLFSEINIISTNAQGANSVFSADIDGDGNVDILSSSRFDDKISWYRNLGEQNFSSEQIISLAADGANNVMAHDVDGDGDLDVIASSFNDSKLAWFENLGNGSFSSRLVIGSNLIRPSSISLGDLNNDGKSDLLASSFERSKLVWFPNISGQGCLDPEACNYNPQAEIDDNSCCFGLCGCTNPFASNYNEFSECDNGSCTYKMYGLVYNDENLNGSKDPNEYGLANQEVVLYPGNLHVFTNDEGVFTFFPLSPGTCSVEAIQDDTFPFSSNLNPRIIEVPSFAFNNTVKFGLNNELDIYDASVFLFGTESGCNHWNVYNVAIQNDGSDALNGIIDLEFDPLFQDYDTYNNVDSVVGNHMYMSFQSLLPGQSLVKSISLLTPTVEFIGEELNLTAGVSFFIEDEFISLVQEELNNTLFCAYDPNDKQVFPSGYEEPHFVLNDTELDYLVRFQNTGNAPATNVLITDTIDSNLDLESFSLRVSSHSVLTTIHPEQRVVEFYFENIMLPDSVTNEPDSHGLIAYSIKPLPNLNHGTEILNEAYIFFDNNPAIITNTTWNTIYTCTDSLASIEGDLFDACFGDTIGLFNNQSYIDNYSWMSDDIEIGSASSIELTLEPNEHEVLLLASNPLCEAIDSVSIIVYPVPEPNFFVDNNTLITTVEGEYQWYLNGEEILDATGQTYTLTEAGDYSLSITNEWSCTATSNSQFVIYTSVEEFDARKIEFFPNPVDESLNIIFPYDYSYDINVRDVAGKLLATHSQIHTKTFMLNVANYEAGVYMIQFISKESTLGYKLLVVE